MLEPEEDAISVEHEVCLRFPFREFQRRSPNRMEIREHRLKAIQKLQEVCPNEVLVASGWTKTIDSIEAERN
jgi:isopentenyldiphosphate isomerase